MIEHGEVTTRIATAHAVAIQAQGTRIHLDLIDATFLACLPKGCGDEAGVRVLNVASQLKPAADERVECQQDPLALDVDDQRAAGEVPPSIGSAQGVAMDG
jgi:hypothetical protein